MGTGLDGGYRQQRRGTFEAMAEYAGHETGGEMKQQSKLDVSKWQAAAREWNYSPTMQFYRRMIEMALIDCNCSLGITALSHGVMVALPNPSADPASMPTDEALLARDWIARSEAPAPCEECEECRFISFAMCCEQLGANVDGSRVALLDAVDRTADFDSDESWTRLEVLSQAESKDDVEPLFDAPRIVPAIDQLSLFAA
jgi:hypothetical protein